MSDTGDGVPKGPWLHFACGACGAKYASPSDKLPATAFRIRCKMCRADVVVPEEGRIYAAKGYPLVGVPARQSG